MPRIRVNDICMHYGVHGAGEPLVIVRGIGGQGRGLPADLAEKGEG